MAPAPGYYRIEAEGDNSDVMAVIPVEPTEGWDNGYNDGYRDGFEAGLLFHRLQPDD